MNNSYLSRLRACVVSNAVTLIVLMCIAAGKFPFREGMKMADSSGFAGCGEQDNNSGLKH